MVLPVRWLRVLENSECLQHAWWHGVASQVARGA
jgi:hypothetical protein